MQNLTLDLSQLTVADPSKGVQVTAGPRRPLPSTDRELIKGALQFGKPFNPNLGSLQDVVGISEKPPTLAIVPSPTIPMFSRGGKSDLTVGVGVTGFVAFVAGLSLAGGIYGSTTGEFGVFGTGGFMFGIVSGGGVGNEATFIFGTPNDFKGVFVAVAASVTVVPPFLSVGGSLLFSPGPVRPGGLVSLIFMGFSLNVSVGGSALPGSFAIEWSNTAILPVIHLK